MWHQRNVKKCSAHGAQHPPLAFSLSLSIPSSPGFLLHLSCAYAPPRAAWSAEVKWLPLRHRHHCTLFLSLSLSGRRVWWVYYQLPPSVFLSRFTGSDAPVVLSQDLHTSARLTRLVLTSILSPLPKTALPVPRVCVWCVARTPIPCLCNLVPIHPLKVHCVSGAAFLRSREWTMLLQS